MSTQTIAPSHRQDPRALMQRALQRIVAIAVMLVLFALLDWAAAPPAGDDHAAPPATADQHTSVAKAGAVAQASAVAPS